MKEIVSDVRLVSLCGLYCGACRKYLNGKCSGCTKNQKATWCKVRSCNLENDYASCADCRAFANPMQCSKFNNIFAKFFALVFRSDRNACLNYIRANGYENFAAFMGKNGWQTIKKK